jgi:2-dehydro-3-deoxygalactonokinase
MTGAAFIAGDWGTSHLRLSLCNTDGNVLAQCSGPGVAQCAAEANIDWAGKLAELTISWPTQHGALPILLCGMIGSNIGWWPVPYVTCPTELGQLSQHLHSPSKNVSIAPGLACRNRNDAPDVMRGEETQILGALRLQPQLTNGRHLLCLPGTHTKWALLEDGTVREFITCATGELFALIKQHSVLVRASEHAGTEHEAIFNRAVGHLQQHAAASLLQLIFECRSRQLAGELSSTNAAAYLSGLLIGEDVFGALRLHAAPTPPIAIIGTPQLTQLYAAVCATRGIQAQQIDGAQASLAGLTVFYLQRNG